MRITESTLRRIIRETLDETHDHTISALLDMDPWTFDQTQEGWRSLPQDLQIDALSAYVEGPLRRPARSSKSGKHVDKSTITWHLGQILATRGDPGDKAQAVGLMKRSLKDDDSQWNDYVEATIAFLEDDRAAFEEHASGENYNGDVLERLRHGWGKLYSQVY
jgi:hypothetical protein